jgi:hypothetical protein
MSAAPAGRAGVIAVIEVAFATATPVAAEPPIETVAPAANPDPVIVTVRPPDVDPSGGATVVSAGAGLFCDGGCDDGPAGLDPPQDQAKSASAAHAAWNPGRL